MILDLAVSCVRFPDFPVSSFQLSVEAVANAWDRDDETRIGRIVLNLLAESEDRDVHCARQRSAPISPNIFEQRFSRDGRSTIHDKELKKAALSFRQRHTIPFSSDFGFLEIDAHAAKAKSGKLCGVFARRVEHIAAA